MTIIQQIVAKKRIEDSAMDNKMRGNPQYLTEWINWKLNGMENTLQPEDGYTGRCDQVYVIFNPSTLLFKIGIANNLEIRFKNLRTACGSEISIAMAYKCQEFVDVAAATMEGLLHKFFRNKRGIGEWFSLSVRDLIAIRLLFDNHDQEELHNLKQFFLSKQIKEKK